MWIVGSKVEILYIVSISGIFLGIYVIMSKNPISSILSLIGLFGSISIYLIWLDITFIGLSYLIIYIGAVSILFLFIVMLIDIRTSELQNDNWNSIGLAFFVCILFSNFIIEVLPENIILSVKFFTDNILSSVTSNDNWDNNLIYISHISSIGSILYTSYSTWILLSSLILVLAMTGAISITIKKTNNNSNIRKSSTS